MKVISVLHAQIINLLIAKFHPKDVKFHKLLLALDPSLKETRGM